MNSHVTQAARLGQSREFPSIIDDFDDSGDNDNEAFFDNIGTASKVSTVAVAPTSSVGTMNSEFGIWE